MIKTTLLPVLFLLCFIFSSQHAAFAQQVKYDNSQTIQKLKKQFKNTYYEKVYLHTDRSTYISGDNIWLQAYLLEGKYHLPTKTSKLLVVELLDAQKKILQTHKIKLTNGLGSGDLKIPFQALTGDFMIRAYTRYMRNFDATYFFHKKIRVLNISDKKAQLALNNSSPKNRKSSRKKQVPPQNKPAINVQFFPEGGHAINQLVNFIAFKAVNTSGKSIEISGDIVNSQGKKVSSFISQKLGMGKFVLIPKAGESYRAQVTYQGKDYTFKLPQSLSQGYLLKAKHHERSIRVTLENNQALPLQNSLLVAHVRGVILSTHLLTTRQSTKALSIPIKSIPSGVVHLTFFDPQGIPRCERLVFVENPQDILQVKISTPSNRYSLRTKASFEASVTDQAGNPVQSSFSLAAVRSDVEASPMHKMNIQNYLWLQSDLKGYIENPAYYFNPKNEDRKAMMDLLMMTQGWRKFQWQDILEAKQAKLRYDFQKGFDISGQLVKYYNRKKAKQGKVTLSFMNDLSNEYTLKTSADGRFSFRNIDITDTVNVLLQTRKALSKARKKKHKTPKNAQSHIKLDQWENAAFPQSFATIADFTQNTQSHRQALQRTQEISSINMQHGLEENIQMLKEVQVSAKKFAPLQFYKNPDQQLVLDSMAGVLSSDNFFEYIDGKIPGVYVVREGSETKIEFTSNANGTRMEPAYFINGIQVARQQLKSIPVNAISHVDVVRRRVPIALVSFDKNGLIAGGGSPYSDATLAIYVFNDKMQIRRARWGIINFKHPGYHKVRKFYMPNYDKKPAKNSKVPDLRRILYWNPSITTSKKGMAKFHLFTSDEEAPYRIEIEGIFQGKILLGAFDFEVSNQE